MEELKEAIRLIHLAKMKFLEMGATLKCNIEIVPFPLFQEKENGQQNQF
jgi:hypothetical protein